MGTTAFDRAQLEYAENNGYNPTATATLSAIHENMVEPVQPVAPVSSSCCAPDTIAINSVSYKDSGAAAEKLNIALTLAASIRMIWCIAALAGYTQIWISFSTADPIIDSSGNVIGIRNGFPMVNQVTNQDPPEHVCFGYSDDITAYFVGSGIVNCLPLILERPVTKLFVHLLTN